MKRFVLCLCVALMAGAIPWPAQADAVWNETVTSTYHCRSEWLTLTYLFEGGPMTRIRGTVTWTAGGSLSWEGNVSNGSSSSFLIPPGGGSVTIEYLEGSGTGPFNIPADSGGCPAGEPSGKQLFKMYLLTGAGKSCVLLSETPPSVESQKRLCFPGEAWVAEQTPCAGPIYENDVWVCDPYGYPRLPLEDLKKVHERHALRTH